MESPKKNPREAALDRFWDIDALLPAKKLHSVASDTGTTELVIEPRDTDMSGVERDVPLPPEAKQPVRHFIPPHTAEEAANRPVPQDEYMPDSAFIRSVRLYLWKSSYRYYEDFVRDAIRLYPIRGREAPAVPFFSYVPQYSQLNTAQLEWYLCWREKIRNGEYPPIDYSYLLLLIYELINLSDKLRPMESQAMLFALWTNYRETYSQLDGYLSEWICDYSLIHHLPPPDGMTGTMLSAVMAHCSLKEFYVRGKGEDGYARALLAFCSNYDYRKSKFYVGDNRALFDRYIPEVLYKVTERLSDEGKLFSSAGLDDSHLTRDAYTGALCSYRVKRKIEVDYCSFSRSHELRFLISDVIKHTENRLRILLGVRSRLTVYALPTAVRECIDTYLDGVLPTREPTVSRRSEPTPEYEKLYDVPHKPLSPEAAAEIERVSWGTTERLAEAFETEEAETLFYTDSLPEEKQKNEVTDGEKTDATRLLLPYLPFLLTAGAGALAQKRAAEPFGKLPDILADEINGIAADALGDILLEDTGDGWDVIEDYRWVTDGLRDAQI